jgi:hypothetical protein
MQGFRTARFSDIKGSKKDTPRTSRFRHNVIRFTRLNALNAISSFKRLRVPVARKDWRMSMSSNLADINRPEISPPTLPLNANVLDAILEQAFFNKFKRPETCRSTN